MIDQIADDVENEAIENGNMAKEDRAGLRTIGTPA